MPHTAKLTQGYSNKFPISLNLGEKLKFIVPVANLTNKVPGCCVIFRCLPIFSAISYPNNFLSSVNVYVHPPNEAHSSVMKNEAQKKRKMSHLPLCSPLNPSLLIRIRQNKRTWKYINIKQNPFFHSFYSHHQHHTNFTFMCPSKRKFFYPVI